MAVSDEARTASNTHVQHAEPTEATPLLERKPSRDAVPKGLSVVLRVLFTGFIVSFTFGITQIPLVYVFRIMECDKYYETHPEPPTGIDRCRNHAIEANTAQSVALLGASTAFFGVFNLFFTSWTIKALGIKRALLLTVLFPGVRLFIQNIGVQIGSGLGIIIVQSSQIITIVGGPAGYLLTLNSFASEVVEPSERTGILGRLSGCAMFGTAFGFLAGGLLGDINILVPFRVTFIGVMLGCLYIVFALPTLPREAAENRPPLSITAFFEPLKMFIPKPWVMPGGNVRTEYGVLLLGIGTFTGVLATSYIPVLLQMYSTDVFDFGTTENGGVIFLNSLIRGLFLTFAFPPLISAGRRWLDKRLAIKDKVKAEDSGIPDIPTPPIQVADVASAIETDQEPTVPPKPKEDEPESFHFDLWFTKYSLILDGLLTGLATFTTEGWQMYLIAVILPFASGTGPAAKGTILQMCPASQRADALSAISLVDLVARLTSTGGFGVIFAAFASMGKPNLTFTVNAAIAVVGFIVLLFARFPPDGSTRFVEVDNSANEERAATAR